MMTALMILGVGLLRGEAGVTEEQVTLSLKNASLQKVFEELKKQTGYHFVYRDEVIKRANKVDVQVTKAMLRDVLLMVFKNQPLTYTIVDRIIVIRTKDTEPVVLMPLGDKTDKGVFSVRGQVMTEGGDPVPGATVIVKNTKKTAVSNDKGEFSLNEIEENTVLVVSSVGYQTKEMFVKAGGKVSVYLKRVINNLDEAVVVAYNTTTQRANTGAVTVIKGDQITTLPNRSFEKSLQGLVPGLLITGGSGQPGSPAANFTLRGIATGGDIADGQTVRNPLVVVDGVPVIQDQIPKNTTSSGTDIFNPMAQLNPSDIESISVLKDAAAIALYGSKASNGVILITTKKGKAGKTQINFTHQTDISSGLTGKISVLNQQEYLELLFEAYRNSMPGITDAQILADLRSTPSPTDPKFPTFVNGQGDSSFYPMSDWTGALFNNSAVTLTNELSISGGNEKSNFFLNLGYTKQNGVVRNTGYDRKSIRFNYENKLAPWLKIGLNTSLSYNIQSFDGSSTVYGTQAISPLNPIYKTDGDYFYNYSWGFADYPDFTAIPNPVAAGKLNINKNTTYRGLTSLYAELKVLKCLTFSSRVGVDFMLNELKDKIHPSLVLPGAFTPGKGRVLQYDYRNANIINSNTLRFNKEFNQQHQVGIILGQEIQVMNTKGTNIEVRDISENPYQDQLNGKILYNATGFSNKQALLSYFGQANYGFQNKYFLSANLRRDGSSRFGVNERFGTYWSIGAGWVLSAEPFLKNAGSWLNFLKLRGSIGPAGNSSAILDMLRYDVLTLINSPNGIGVLPNTDFNPGNPGIRWERTFTWNGGIETRLFKERLVITADLYNRKTTDLIAHNIQLPTATGYHTYSDNIGDVKNTGIEISISADVIRNRDFRWNVNANWSRNRNKLVKAYVPLQVVVGNVANKVGLEYNSFYMPVWAGVNPANGRPQWVDSVTGKPTESYFASKPEFVGKIQPDGFGAITNTFSWKGIELSVMIYYQYGGQIYYSSILQNDGMYPYLNQSKSALKRWQKPGDIAPNPRRLLNGIAGTEFDMGSYPSTRFLFDGDYIRLSNVLLAYNFPKKMLDPLGISYLRVFVQGHNLATRTKYSGQDPDNLNGLGSGNFLYPQQKSYSIGLNLNF